MSAVGKRSRRAALVIGPLLLLLGTLSAAAATAARSSGEPVSAASTDIGPITEEPVAAAPSSGAAAGTGTGDEPTRADTRAETQAELMAVSCRDAENRPDSWLDRTHSYLNQRLCEPAAWFDGFFGDDRALEETPVGTFFRLRNEVRWDESEDAQARVRLSANISLPGASDRLRLLLTRDEDVRGDLEGEVPTDRNDQETRLGLRYNLSDAQRSRLDLDATVRANFTSLNPVLRARYRHVRPVNEDTFLRFTQIGFWEREDGYGATTRGDWEWYRSFDTQLRYTAEGTWSEATDGVDWRTSVTGFHQLNSATALRAEVGTTGWTDPRFEAGEHFVNFRFRRTFLRPWLFYELQPERAWVQERDDTSRQGDWRFILTLEIQFENAPARAEREEREDRRFHGWLERQLESESATPAATDPD